MSTTTTKYVVRLRGCPSWSTTRDTEAEARLAASTMWEYKNAAPGLVWIEKVVTTKERIEL